MKLPIGFCLQDVTLIKQQTGELQTVFEQVVSFQEESKLLIEGSPAAWCKTQNCRLSLHQSGKTLMVSSDDGERGNPF